MCWGVGVAKDRPRSGQGRVIGQCVGHGGGLSSLTLFLFQVANVPTGGNAHGRARPWTLHQRTCTLHSPHMVGPSLLVGSQEVVRNCVCGHASKGKESLWLGLGQWILLRRGVAASAAGPRIESDDQTMPRRPPPPPASTSTNSSGAGILPSPPGGGGGAPPPLLQLSAPRLRRRAPCLP